MLKMLAFDLGASNGRAVLGSFDGNRVTVREMHRFSNTPVRAAGMLYWDVLRLFHEIQWGISKSAREHGDIVSLAVDTWGTDFGLLDEKGYLLSNPYHYRNTYPLGTLEEVLKKVTLEELYTSIGAEMYEFTTLFMVYAMQSRNHSHFKCARTFLFMPDLFNYLLSGVKTTEYTIASTSRLISAEKKNWLYGLMDTLNIPREIFTEIIAPGTVIGELRDEVAAETGCRKLKVVATASHDTASAVAALPAEEQDIIYISSGTWSVVGIEVERPIITEKAMKSGFINEGGVCGKIRFLKNIMGLWFVEACRSDWEMRGEGISYGEMDGMAERAVQFGSFIDPGHESFVLHGDMPRKIRDYCSRTSQRVPEDKGAVIRTINESLAMEYRRTIEQLEEFSGKRFKKIFIVGGGVKNKALCQYTANATKREVVAGYSETVSLGSILVQAMALGEIAGLSQLRQVAKESFPVEYYHPLKQEAWDEAYEEYLKVRNKNNENI